MRKQNTQAQKNIPKIEIENSKILGIENTGNLGGGAAGRDDEKIAQKKNYIDIKYFIN